MAGGASPGLPARPRVVVIGAGFAGLAAARRLAREAVEVTVVDRRDYHLFTPLLYQVASALLTPFEIVRPVRKLLAVTAGRGSVDFRLANVTGLDLDRRAVLTDHGEIRYDYLVAAAGSVTSFPSPALERRCLGLKDLDDAVTLRARTLERFEAAAWEPDEARRRALLAFVVVGGGPTGVEFAGALADLVDRLTLRTFPDLDRAEVTIRIVEAEPTLLTAFGPRLAASAARTLTAKRITVTRGRVTSVAAAHLTLEDGRRLPSGLTVWAAGVRASDLGAGLAAEPGKGGTVPVDATLRLPGHPEVFVVGDLAAVTAGRAILPMLAAVASQEGEHAARGIARLVAGHTTLAPFRYRDRGLMATNGRYQAVVRIGRFRLDGPIGWLAWLAVHAVLLNGFTGRLRVVASWIGAFVFQDRPVQIIGPLSRPGRSR